MINQFFREHAVLCKSLTQIDFCDLYLDGKCIRCRLGFTGHSTDDGYLEFCTNQIQDCDYYTKVHQLTTQYTSALTLVNSIDSLATCYRCNNDKVPYLFATVDSNKVLANKSDNALPNHLVLLD